MESNNESTMNAFVSMYYDGDDEPEFFEEFNYERANHYDKHMDEDDSEDEFFEEKEPTWEEIQKQEELLKALKREEARKQMEGMNLEGKLNWCNAELTTTFECNFEEDDQEFPPLHHQPQPVSSKVTKKYKHPGKNMNLFTRIGTTNYIGFREIQCRYGTICKRKHNCYFSHDLPAVWLRFQSNRKDQKRKENNSSNKVEAFKKTNNYNRFALLQEDSETPKLPYPPYPYPPPNMPYPPPHMPYPPPNMSLPPPNMMSPPPPYLSPPNMNASPPKKNASPSSKKNESKKHLLCKNMFIVEPHRFAVVKPCRFGFDCIYAHSWTEVRDVVNNPGWFCSHANQCKFIAMEMIQKMDPKTKQFLPVRRYTNKMGTRPCFKLHENERIKDYICRTQYRSM